MTTHARALLLLAALLAPAVAGCIGAESATGLPECEATAGGEGPGFMKYTFFVRLTPPEGSSATVLVPLPRHAHTGDVAPFVGCLEAREGAATWRLVESEHGELLEVSTSSASARVRAALLVDEAPADGGERWNYTLAPLERELTSVPARPSDATQRTHPLAATWVHASVSNATVRVFFALDASKDDAHVAHRQDVVELRSDAGWTRAVVFREYSTLR